MNGMRLSVLGMIIVGFGAVANAVDEYPYRGAEKNDQKGIIHKVIVTTATEVRRDPAKPKPDSVPAKKPEKLKPFSIRYQIQILEDDVSGSASIRKSSDGKKNINGFGEVLVVDGKEWVKIGRSTHKSDGWIDASQARSWKTRSALEPKGLEGRPMTVYPTKDLNDDDDTIKSTPRKKNDDARTHTTLALILEPPENRDDPVYEMVLYTGRIDFDTPSFEDSIIEMVFVIDTTRSMAPLLKGVKAVVKQTATALSSKNLESVKSQFRFGLVEYQDSTPGLTPAHVRIPLTDIDSFVDQFELVNVTDLPSEEEAEDVVAGLMAALTHDPKDSKKSVGWSVNSSKHIILLGDASAHLPPSPKSTTGKTIADVLEIAHKSDEKKLESHFKNYNIHSILASHGINNPDSKLAKEQFELLSKHRGRTEGLHDVLENQSAPEIKRVVDGMVVSFKQLAAIVKSPVAFKDRVDSGKTTVAPITATFWKLYPGADQTTQVRHGWGQAWNKERQETATDVLFIRYVELRRLKSKLTQLLDDLDLLKSRPEERGDTKQLLASMRSIFAKTHTGEPIDENTKLQDIIKDLPLQNDALTISVVDIAGMDNAEFASWVRRIESTRKRAQEMIDDPIDEWVVLDKESLEMFRFLRINELP